MSSWLIVMVFGIVSLVVVAAVLLPLILRVVTSLRRAARVANSPRRSAEATVVNKRTELTGRGRDTDQLYYATFQFPDGQRVELSVSGMESGILAVGDQGTLEWQGPRYLGFAREILR